LTIAVAYNEDASLRYEVRLARPVAADHGWRNVGVAAERRLVVVTGVAFKEGLTFGGWPHAGEQRAAIGGSDRNKRRHTVQAEGAPVVAERTGDGSIVIEGDSAASLAAWTVDGQSGGSIHYSLLAQQWVSRPILAYGCVSDSHSGGWGFEHEGADQRLWQLA